MACSQPRSSQALKVVFLSLHLEASFPCSLKPVSPAGLSASQCMAAAGLAGRGDSLSLTVCLFTQCQKCCSEMVSTGRSKRVLKFGWPSYPPISWSTCRERRCITFLCFSLELIVKNCNPSKTSFRIETRSAQQAKIGLILGRFSLLFSPLQILSGTRLWAVLMSAIPFSFRGSARTK